mgnify:CR=1 FL=1
MKTLITVGRSFGSGGGFVAQEIGRQLGIKVWDNDLISKAAEESGFSKDLFARSDESKSAFSLSSFFSSWRFSSAQDYVGGDALFRIQSEVIRRIASEGPAIFVGRCSDYILRDMDKLNVFVSAPDEFRIARVASREDMTPEEAEELIRKKDRTRQAYYNFFTFGNWGSAAGYDLCVDSSILGIEETAEFIINFGRRAGKIDG